MAFVRSSADDKKFSTPADNFIPARNYIRGTLDAYCLENKTDNKALCYTLRYAEDSPKVKVPSKTLFLLDDGYTLKTYYVAGYSQDATELYLYPQSAGLTGTDGPRFAYFLSLQAAD